MSAFEAEKNQKAFLYTAAIAVALLLIAIFWKWELPGIPVPPPQEAIEINLGNFDEGMGQVQPLIKGDKAPGDEPTEQQKQHVAASNSEPSKDVEPDDNKDEDAAPVTKPEKAVTKPTELPAQPTTKPIKATTPAVVPEPKPQKPKIAGYSGPKGGTGNGADETNAYKYQGNKPGGKGDAGDPNGKPDAYGNTPGGKSTGGASVTKGVRPFNLGSLRFEDDFNENAKVYVDVSYNSAGNFVSATTAKGTTTSNSKILSIARQKLTALKFPPSLDGGVSTILLNFKVQ